MSPSVLNSDAGSALLAAASEPTHTDNDTVLALAALLGIGTVVVLITVVKVHPFLVLIILSGVVILVAGLGLDSTIDSFTDGVGSAVASVCILIALGAISGKLFADSGVA